MNKNSPVHAEVSSERRKALARLGLAVGAIYVAPLLTDLGSADAQNNQGNGGRHRHGSEPCGPNQQGNNNCQ